MGELSVFGTEGDAVYPPETDSDASMARYFSQQVFALQPGGNGQSPMVEAYFSARTERGKPNNYSLRYVGETTENLFKECREAVQRELVEGLGWTIEGAQRGEAAVFTRAIWKPNTDRGSGNTEFFHSGQFGFDDTEAEIFRDMPSKAEAPPVRITASGYDEIASVLPAFLETSYTVVVSKERTAPPDWADVQFRPSKSLYSGFELHGETEQYIQDQKQEYQRQLREQEFQNIRESLETLNRLGADRSEVVDRLSSALGQSYNSLRLLTVQDLRSQREEARKEGRAAAKRQESSGGTKTESDRLGKSSSSKKISRRSTLLVGLALALVLIAIVAIAMYVPLPIGQGSGSSGVSASVVSTNSTAFTMEVSGGDGDKYEITVDNGSNTVRERTVQGTGEGTNTTFTNLKSGNYTVNVTAQSSSTELGVEIGSKVKSPSPTPTAAATQTPTTGVTSTSTASKNSTGN